MNKSFKKQLSTKELVFVGVDHKNPINKKLYENVKNNVNKYFFLIEVDSRFSQPDILKFKKGTIGDPAIDQIIELFNNSTGRKYIRGWDSRRKVLEYVSSSGKKTDYQNALYGFHSNGMPFLAELKLIDIMMLFISKIDVDKRSLIKNPDNYDRGVANYINHHLSKYNEEYIKSTYTDSGALFDKTVRKLNGAEVWDKVLIKDLLETKQQRDILSELIIKIRVDFMDISDLMNLKTLLKKDRISYIVFVGENHLFNLNKHIKNIYG